MKKTAILFFGATGLMFMLAIIFGFVLKNLELGIVFTALSAFTPLTISMYSENKNQTEKTQTQQTSN